MSGKVTNVLIVGVGGQGVILASNILCEAAMRAGFDVKKSEIHGMSQRGGVVTSHVRFGEKVYSPLIAAGTSEVILAFEVAEALRFAHELQEGGVLLSSTQQIHPPKGPERKDSVQYPTDALKIAEGVAKGKVVPIETQQIAKELGNPKLTNTILLGALSTKLEMISEEVWFDTIKSMVPPKTIELNVQAFQRGRQVVEEAGLELT